MFFVGYEPVGHTLHEVCEYNDIFPTGVAIFVLQNNNDTTGVKVAEGHSLEEILRNDRSLCNAKVAIHADFFGESVFRVIKEPIICNILGVSVGERFFIKEVDATFWIKQDGTFCTRPKNVAGSTRALLRALEDHTLVCHLPKFTEEEIYLCRQLYNSGARWLARGKHLRWYVNKPYLREEDGRWDMTGDWGKHSGRLPYNLLPSLQSQSMVCLEDVICEVSND